VRRLSGLLAAAALVSALVAGAAVAGSRTVSDGGTATPAVDTGSAIVQLNGDSLSTYSKTKPPTGKKIDFSSTAVKSYRAQLSALRNDFKAWLKANAPAANVTGSFDIALNAVSVRLNGTQLSTIASAPQVTSAQYEGLYHPLVDDPDLGLISALQAWGAGGSANAGKGVKVAVVDTGIDITHPCFDDTGYPPQPGNGPFTNNKVIVAKVFNNNAKNKGYTAEALQEHGTHVAGTIACDANTAATVNGVAIPYGMSGVAPSATLGNYNVFPADVTNARSEDILNALDAAYEDGMDVANMSLGGGSHGEQDLLMQAVNHFDEADMVVAIAAGNSGPGLFTVESPGAAKRALTAGASTVPHFVGAPITVGGTTYFGATGDFAVVSADLTAPLAALSGSPLGLGCSALAGGSLTGKIALISRGTCTFQTKIRNAQNAGAVAAIIVNNVAGDPIAMGQDGTTPVPTIPAYMVSRDARADLIADNGLATTISATLQYVATTNGDIMAGFSSQGPTDVDFRVKPDVVAPGVNVLSSIPHQFCAAPPCFAFFQGTSMATPHLAGSAAVVLSQHPTWSAARVRSAIVNTADQGVLKNFSTGATETEVQITGAGRENLLSAVGAKLGLDPVSVSFGAVPAGSGQTRTETIAVTQNVAGSYTASITPGSGGVHYSVSPFGDTITVTMTADKGAARGGHSAILSIKQGDDVVAHAVVYAFVK